MAERQRNQEAIAGLRRHSGGTWMAAGLEQVREALDPLGQSDVKRAIILTDGQTGDEPRCATLAEQLGARNVSLIPLGLGTTCNQELLMRIASLGRGHHLHLAQVDNLGAFLADELSASVREVVTDVRATVSTVKGVTLDRITRVYPSLVPVEAVGHPHRLGNLPAGDYTMFILEFTVSGVARSPCRARIAHRDVAAPAP